LRRVSPNPPITVAKFNQFASSNLSSKGFYEYFDELKKQKIIREITDKRGKKFITLTDKGFKYLGGYKMVRGFIEDFGI